MTDTVVTASPVAASPSTKKTAPIKKKATAGAAKGSKPAAAHPTTSVMVTSAIKELKEKKGSSLPAIKKYLAANYKVDPAKLAPFIRKFLKAAVANKTIVQTKGTGASGHFKLAVAEAKPKKKVVAKKTPVAKKSKVAGTPKRKKPVAKKVKSASGEPTAKKAKKSVASKATKPKTPTKPKKPSALKPKATAKSPKKAIKKVAVAPKKK